MSGRKILIGKDKLIDPFNLKAEDVSIDDIATALSNICRFGGHVETFYSVAQHSVLVSQCLEHWEPANRVLMLQGLFHDASEAYLGDIVSPCKSDFYVNTGTDDTPVIEPYKDVEARLQKLILGKLGVCDSLTPEVHLADMYVLRLEFSQLKGDEYEKYVSKLVGVETWDKKIIPVSPKRARDLFLDRYSELL